MTPLPTPRNRHERRAAPHADKIGLSIMAFCERYAIGRTYAYELIKAGEIDARKAGARTIIVAESAERWFANLSRAQSISASNEAA